MKEFYVTFGVQYAHEPHPLDIHPDGYLTIVANDYEQAREQAFKLTGGKFAFMYEERPAAQHFPMGEIMRVIVEGDATGGAA